MSVAYAQGKDDSAGESSGCRNLLLEDYIQDYIFWGSDTALLSTNALNSMKLNSLLLVA